MSWTTEVIADSPLVFYRLEETGGSTITDISGNGNHGTVAGSPALGRRGALAAGDLAAGNWSNANNITMPAGVTLTAGHAISVEFWLKPTSALACGVFNFGLNAAPSLCQAGVPYSDGNIYWDYGTNTGGPPNGRVSVAYGTIDGNWHHIVLTADTNFMGIYRDGALLTSKASWQPPTATISTGTVGYASSFGSANPGDIDEFAIYGTALSSGRIAAHYAAGLVGPPGALRRFPIGV